MYQPIIPLEEAIKTTNECLEKNGQGVAYVRGYNARIGVCSSYNFDALDTGDSKAARFAALFSRVNRYPCVISGTLDDGSNDNFYRKEIKKHFREKICVIIVTPISNSWDAIQIRTPVVPKDGGLYGELTSAAMRAFKKAMPNDSIRIIADYGQRHPESVASYLSHYHNIPAIEIAVNEKFLCMGKWIDVNYGLSLVMREFSDLLAPEDEIESEV